ncbi:uncharacterized protein C17orf114-like [Phyllopteryx taeniolatus]|uniref:uncharacterized protein C17orf114-like n=1 Tax=Phyllopteryx taeniolatus TaxID=161469 RepID=UPI002AD4880D|nr:uncharacterized protein C17orf114-like [Phyllopteryx taeniolatus]
MLIYDDSFTCLCGCSMGVRTLQCFPFCRRCKSKGSPSAAAETRPTKTRFNSARSPSSSSSSQEERKAARPASGDGPSRGPRIYFSSKARMSFRHQLDGNVNAADATD